MKFVLVGGSGFIGTAVSRSLQQSGHEVVNVSRSGKSAAGSPSVPYGSLREVCEGADAVTNLAGANVGEKRWTKKRRQELVNSRIEPTRAIAQAIRECSNKPALISMSGTGYYGHTTIPCNEAMGHGYTFLSKLAGIWEEEANAVADQTRVVTLRMAPLLSVEDGPLGRLLPLFNKFLGARLGSGRQFFPWIHKDDAVNAVIWAATTATAEGPYNVTGPEEATMGSFTKTLGKVLNRPVWLWVPQPVLYLMLGRMADTVDDSVRAYPMRLLGTSFTFEHPTMEGALRNLLGRK